MHVRSPDEFDNAGSGGRENNGRVVLADVVGKHVYIKFIADGKHHPTPHCTLAVSPIVSFLVDRIGKWLHKRQPVATNRVGSTSSEIAAECSIGNIRIVRNSHDVLAGGGEGVTQVSVHAFGRFVWCGCIVVGSQRVACRSNNRKKELSPFSPLSKVSTSKSMVCPAYASKE